MAPVMAAVPVSVVQVGPSSPSRRRGPRFACITPLAALRIAADAPLMVLRDEAVSCPVTSSSRRHQATSRGARWRSPTAAAGNSIAGQLRPHAARAATAEIPARRPHHLRARAAAAMVRYVLELTCWRAEAPRCARASQLQEMIVVRGAIAYTSEVFIFVSATPQLADRISAKLPSIRRKISWQAVSLGHRKTN